MDEFNIKASHYFLGAVALTAALSWNALVKDTISAYCPIPKDSLPAQLTYAVAMVIILLILVWMLPDTSPELPEHVREKINQKTELQRMRWELNYLKFIMRQGALTQ
jgi:hypothetical protein